MQSAEPFVSSLGADDSEQHGPGYQPRQLLLLGAGPAHVHMLQSLAAHPLVGVRVVLVAPQPRQVMAAMVPGYVAGHYSLDECAVALEPLVRSAGVRWLQRNVRHLDANHRALLMDDGSRVEYEWLSIDTGPVQNREQIEHDMPGAREHGLFMRPIEAFSGLWPQVASMGQKRPLRVTVVGGGVSGFELACAVRQRLANAAVTWLAGPRAVGEGLAPGVRASMLRALRTRRITLLQDVATGVRADLVNLGCGAELACDVTIVSTGAQPPLWLGASGLQLDARGRVLVNDFQQCLSHPSVFAVGDVCARIEPQTGFIATARSGPALAHNLTQAVAGAPLRALHPASRVLRFMSCGNRYALATWGNHSAEGHWLWWLKNWLDRRQVARYRRA